jgi:G3E family GTPase
MEAAQASAAWVRELMGEHTPETEEYGISSVLFSARRPFHPARLWERLHHGDWAGVIRSKGFFWLATRPEEVFLWSQAGGACSYEVTGHWWASVPRESWPEHPDDRAGIEADWDVRFGDRRQQIVMIGRGMDGPAMLAAMEACLCTDEELGGGEAAWAFLEDPFPARVPQAG